MPTRRSAIDSNAVMATENDSADRSIQMQFQSTEENGEISTFKLEDSLERAEMDISRFFSEAPDGDSAPAQKHLVYQPSRPNFEFLEGRSRSTLIYRRLQRPSTRDRKRKKRGRCENLSAFGWVFLSLALLQSKRGSCSPCHVALCKLRVRVAEQRYARYSIRSGTMGRYAVIIS